MTAQRATLLLAGAAALALSPAPSMAQADDGIVLNIMRECAKIDDPTARLACYDNNIRSAGAAPRASVPGQMDTPSGGSGAAVTSSGSQGFGSESIRQQRRAAADASQSSLTARVARVDQREPGVYMLTLENGAQWAFTESVDRSYIVPRRGDTIEIDRAALGSFLLRHRGQSGVGIRRER